MLAGTLPFPGDSVQETMIKRLPDEPLELIEMRPDLHFPPGLQQTLDTALARSPVHRYQSAAKFAHDLAAVDRAAGERDRKSTRLNSSHGYISYAVFCLKKKKKEEKSI